MAVDELVTLEIEYTNGGADSVVEFQVTYRPSALSSLIEASSDGLELLSNLSEFITTWDLQDASGAMWPIDGNNLPRPLAGRMLEAIVNHEERNNVRSPLFRPNTRPLSGVRRV